MNRHVDRFDQLFGLVDHFFRTFDDKCVDALVRSDGNATFGRTAGAAEEFSNVGCFGILQASGDCLTLFECVDELFLISEDPGVANLANRKTVGFGDQVHGFLVVNV